MIQIDVAMVFCGGKSSRMGKPKEALRIGGQTLLARTVEIVSRYANRTIIVAAASQSLPSVSPAVSVVRDARPGRGPLEGLYAGLTAAGDKACCLAVSCDLPLLRPQAVEYLIAQMTDDAEIVIPREGKFFHPLFAIYRTAVTDRVRRLLDEDRLRPFFLLQECQVRQVPVEDFRAVDPQLDSFRNVNTPQEFAAAVQRYEQGP